MSLKRCTNAQGKHGWSWGDGGCQVGATDKESKKQAIRVGLKVAGPKKFSEIMQRDKGSFIDNEGLSIAKAVYKEMYPRGAADEFLHSISNYFSKSDTGKVVDDNDDTDVRDGENVNASDEEVQDEVQTEAGLDTPVKEAGINIVTPPFRSEVSPESNPEDEVPDVKPPTREDMSVADDDNGEESEAMDDDDESTEAYIAIAFISSEERSHIPLDDFADKSRRAYPITSPKHVLSALRLLHYSDNPSEVKRNIIKIARRKNYPLPSHLSHDESCIQ